MSIADGLVKEQTSGIDRNVIKIQSVDNGFIVTVDRGLSYKQLVFQHCEAAEMVEELCRFLGITHLVYDQISLQTSQQEATDKETQSSSKSGSTLSSDSV